ncbi:MAG: histidine--tRNA ligase [bacterium]
MGEDTPIARIPRGFRDIPAGEVLMRDAMIATIKRVYQSYGFTPLETPHVEYLDILGKYLPESDQPDQGVFAFRDDSENWVALRYDLTAPLARYVAENEKTIPFPYRRYQVGPVFRVESPGPGRFREFYQFDFDTVGAESVAADAEACMILADTFEALGIARDKYVVCANNRKVLNGVLEVAGIRSTGMTPENKEEKLGKAIAVSSQPTLNEVALETGYTAMTVLRAIDKLDRLGIDGVTELLGKGRKDESGEFTKGADLNESQIAQIQAFLSIPAGGYKAVCDAMAELVKDSAEGIEGVGELRLIGNLLEAGGYGDGRVIFDPTIVRGLAYYTGPVVEARLTFEVVDEDNKPRQFGSVAGGGRYDTLVERFLQRKVPATGASIGVDRLLAALSHLKLLESAQLQPPVLITTMDKNYLKEYQEMTVELRRVGIPAEMYMGGGGIRRQVKYADQRNIPVAVICGGDEFSKGEVSVKDLLLGRELAAGIKDRDAWRVDRPQQMTVPRAELLATVKKMLGKE